MSSEDGCSEEMFVELRYREGIVEDIFSVPLTDVNPIDVDERTASDRGLELLDRQRL